MHIRFLKLTPIERELLLHRLTLDDCVSECLAADQVDHNDPDYDAKIAKAEERIANHCHALEAEVRQGHIAIRAGFLHTDVIAAETERYDILEDVCDGSTFFANEELETGPNRAYGQKPASWWARRHAAATSLEEKLTEALGRKITFARY